MKQNPFFCIHYLEKPLLQAILQIHFLSIEQNLLTPLLMRSFLIRSREDSPSRLLQ
jgi:hypothetical protein